MQPDSSHAIFVAEMEKKKCKVVGEKKQTTKTAHCTSASWFGGGGRMGKEGSSTGQLRALDR